MLRVFAHARLILRQAGRWARAGNRDTVSQLDQRKLGSHPHEITTALAATAAPLIFSFSAINIALDESARSSSRYKVFKNRSIDGLYI